MAQAVLRQFRESPRRLRVVAGMIRGKSVAEALTILKLQQRKAATVLTKVLNSAVANATENEKADADQLFVTRVCVDGGAVQRRWLPRAMGRANRLNRRTAHITVVVDLPEE